MALPRRQLVILQQSPFCNIDCTYCYLPYRSQKHRMSFDTLSKIYEEVFNSQKIHDPITFLWHAGEPLIVGHEYFEQAFDLCREINKHYNRTYVHNIQTNATLIDEKWADIFEKYKILLGISIDGPDFIHNCQRVNRAGQGTHAQVMRGIKILQDRNIPFEVIMVLTKYALDFPREVFEFFVENSIKGVGFNIDELEGVHNVSSYMSDDATYKYQVFMKTFLELLYQHPGILKVREFNSMLPIVSNPNAKLGNGEGFNNTNVPLQLLTINYQGNYSTFCPELSGTPSMLYGDFIMGNVFTHPIDRIFEHPVFQKVNDEIQLGVQRCRNSCEYWSLCGGGSPANKFFETGKFDVTETMHCRIHVKTLTKTMMEFLEEKLLPIS